MDQDERERIEQALGWIPRAAWDDLLERPEGRSLAARRNAVRECLREMKRLSLGAPAGPSRDVVDLLGHRLLSDRALGGWIRHQLLLTLAPTKWDRLSDQYREVAGGSAATLDRRATQEGKGSRVMAEHWFQGSRWAAAFCEALELPELLATRREDRLPDDESIEPSVVLGPLHDFQTDVYGRLRELLANGRGQSALLSLPTGAGKTRVAVDALCDHVAAQGNERRPRDLVLWIAQSTELQMQAWSCFRQVWQAPLSAPSVPRTAPLALKRAWGGRKRDTLEIDDGPTVVVAGIAQLHSWLENHRDFYENFPRKRLAAVVIDEAHGLVTPSHRDVLTALGLRTANHWRLPSDAPLVIGLTATPWRRNDSQSASLRSYFQQRLITPKQLGRRPITALQARGILSKVQWQALPFAEAPPLTAAEQRHFEALHDLPGEYLERLGWVEKRNAIIVRELLELPASSRALVFACSVEHAEVLTLLLNRASGREVGAVVTGRTPRAERADTIARFRANGTLRFLCNVGVLTTGFDAPQANVVCITRPTTSAALYEQMVGRGLRGPKNGGTATCRVLDVQDAGLPDEIMSYQRVQAAWAEVDDE